jgi:hypothetical protein
MSQRMRTSKSVLALFAALACYGWNRTTASAEPVQIEEGASIRMTREAVLNGVTIAKGAELRIVGVRKDENGVVTRVDLQQVVGDKRVFMGIVRAVGPHGSADARRAGGRPRVDFQSGGADSHSPGALARQFGLRPRLDPASRARGER